MTVRVIRILEYVYSSHERCEQDMQRWAVGANSVQRHGDMTISSATMIPRTVGEGEQTLGEAQALKPPAADPVEFSFKESDPVVEKGTGICGHIIAYIGDGEWLWKDIHGDQRKTNSDRLVRRDR